MTFRRTALAITFTTALVSWPLTALGHDPGFGHRHGRHHHDHGPIPWCYDVSGDFASHLDTGPDCPSPMGMCTNGQLTGDLEGSYLFIFETLVPAPTADHPNRSNYTGHSVITTEYGVMRSDDTGVMDTFPDGTGAFVTGVGIVTGEGCYEGVTGYLSAPGHLDFSTGQAIGTWSGQLRGHAGVGACLFPQRRRPHACFEE